MRVWQAMGLAGLFAVVGCGSDPEEVEAPPATAPRLVGRVASVNASEGFALVEGFGDWQLGEGLLLSSASDDGRTGTLLVSGETMGRFSAADLKSGDVRVGDAVYGRPRAVIADEITPEPATPAFPGNQAISP